MRSRQSKIQLRELRVDSLSSSDGKVLARGEGRLNCCFGMFWPENRMSHSEVPTTLVLCCPVLSDCTALTLDAMVRACKQAIVPVTWVAATEDLERVRDAVGGADRSGGIALELSPSWFSSRQALRQMLGRARAAIPSLDTVVLRGSTPLIHRAVLVEEGVRTICVDHFDNQTRGNRRPAPQGWACRSVVWGLWEVQTTPPHFSGFVRNLFSWSAAPRLVSGSLAVLQAGGGGTTRGTHERLVQLLRWVDRKRCTGNLHLAGLADVPALLKGAGHGAIGGSVLKAA